MTNQIALMGFKSYLKAMKQDEITIQEIAEALVDSLGIYDASEIAREIEKAEKSIPQNEPAL